MISLLMRTKSERENVLLSHDVKLNGGAILAHTEVVFILQLRQAFDFLAIQNDVAIASIRRYIGLA